MRMANCHPNLPHWAKGLCSTCYAREWSRANTDKVKRRRENRKPSQCHPDMPELARGMCGTCYRRWWRENNPEQARETGANGQRKRYREKTMEERRELMLRRYGLTGESYDRLLAEQDGKCASCFRPSAKRLHVDHCHETGKVRGLLCGNCNSALGHAKDDIDRLRLLIDYLLKSQTKEAAA
jgi:hypothetical protein